MGHADHAEKNEVNN